MLPWKIVLLLLPVLLLATVVENARGYRILGLFPHPGRSHHYVFEPLLIRLAERGHEMTVVAHVPPKNPPPNWTHIGMGDFRHLYGESVDLGHYEDSSIRGRLQYLAELPFLASLGYAMCEAMIGLPEVRAMVANASRGAAAFDLVLTEQFVSDCPLAVAHLLSAPSVSLQSHTLMPWTHERFGAAETPSHVPNLFSGYTIRMRGALERAENALAHLYFKYGHRWVVQRPERELVARSFGVALPPLEVVARQVSTSMLSNTHFALNGPRALGPGVVEVAGMHLKRRLDPIGEELEKFMNASTHGVILFSMGSMIKAHTFPRYKLNYLFAIFERLDQNVIWKWEGEIYPEMPKNVFVMKWVPQMEILHHPKTRAFISHGGMLGTVEALHAGVPTLFLPVFGDQKGNAAAAEMSGLGVSVPYIYITMEKLEAAMARVMSPSMRESARRLSEAWRDLPDPLETAVLHVEHVIRHGSHLRKSPVGDLNFVEYYLLDVALMVIVILYCSVYFVYKCIRLIVKLVVPVSNKKPEAKSKTH